MNFLIYILNVQKVFLSFIVNIPKHPFLRTDLDPAGHQGRIWTLSPATRSPGFTTTGRGGGVSYILTVCPPHTLIAPSSNQILLFYLWFLLTGFYCHGFFKKWFHCIASAIIFWFGSRVPFDAIKWH